MSHEPSYKHDYYLDVAIQTKEYKRAKPKAMKILRKHEFESIAFRGMSGALLAVPLIHSLRKTMLMCRKPEDTTHSYDGKTQRTGRVEGDRAVKRYVIVDDFVASGTTVREIVAAVKLFAPEAECIGVLEMRCMHRGEEKAQDIQPVERWLK